MFSRTFVHLLLPKVKFISYCYEMSCADDDVFSFGNIFRYAGTEWAQIGKVDALYPVQGAPFVLEVSLRRDHLMMVQMVLEC